VTIKSIANNERLIFAMDVADCDQARVLADELGDSVVFYKLGLEFFLSGHYFELAEELRSRGKKIFADLKLFDIPATVASAVRQLARHQVNFCTVHGNDSMLKAAAEAKGDMQILAVTALTSLDQGDLDVLITAALRLVGSSKEDVSRRRQKFRIRRFRISRDV